MTTLVMILLGAGATASWALFMGPIGRAVARWIEAINAARGRGLRIVAVDLPSGVAADTGQVLGVAVA